MCQMHRFIYDTDYIPHSFTYVLLLLGHLVALNSRCLVQLRIVTSTSCGTHPP